MDSGACRRPWVPNSGGGFKANSAIPLKWQYTNAAGVVVDSATANPTIVINGPYLCGGADTTDVIQVTASGNSGYQYDATTKTWQLNWKTTGLLGNKCYNIYISLGVAGRTTSAFPTLLVK
jgi:hypothetical protein